MNRIIIIGNGFDRAHNLRTGYKEFIDDYWSEFASKIINIVEETNNSCYTISPFNDNYASLDNIYPEPVENCMLPETSEKPKSYKDIIDYIKNFNKYLHTAKFELIFKNKFFGHISEQCSLKNWLDIENEYYEELKKILSDEDTSRRNARVKRLNKELKAVEDLLEDHLTKVTEKSNRIKFQSIQKAFSSPVELNDIATCKQHEFVNSIFSEIELFGNIMEFEEDKKKDPHYTICNTTDKERIYFIKKSLEKDYFKKIYCMPYTLLLNFNYTKTAENLYIKKDMNFEIINIHGELDNEDNPIIFGYGDELDEDYQKIEKTQDNDFLENIKSIKYHQTRNYRELLRFIESGIYQVFVMGHSCGNSDRTLLNTLFEHNNCASIKVFYRQFEDGTDDYSNLIRNISRNFNDKPKMRDIVVNREYCSPLVPFNEKALLEQQNIQIVSELIRIQ